MLQKTEFRQEYTARCPGCGKDALFTTVGMPLRTEQRQADFGFIEPERLTAKFIDRIEVACIDCDG